MATGLGLGLRNLQYASMVCGVWHMGCGIWETQVPFAHTSCEYIVREEEEYIQGERGAGYMKKAYIGSSVQYTIGDGTEHLGLRIFGRL